MLLPCARADSALEELQGLQPLPDSELEGIAGGDGIGIAAHIALNDPTLNNPVTDSRIAIGHTVNGATNYIVIKNLRGNVDISGMLLQVQKKPDGSSYLELTLPEHIRLGNVGFESLSVQSDPAAPVTGNLGRVSIDGTINLQGQLRVWAH
ncbi:hypothetical protein G3574_23260 [Noviherbaspirillum sp. 17J57-3]|uniref:Uncharacterized protein n=1 Tax=Noviherbaspirillum galbum TaxID=2709383 RepID=A0A6B3SYS7_9BURK|nr:hypothetical protein [Noviherbaspirillum galbum]